MFCDIIILRNICEEFKQADEDESFHYRTHL